MSDLQDIRSRLRDDVRRGSSSSDEGGGGNYTLVIVGCGLIIGFALFMFVPRFFQSGSGTAVVRDVGGVRVDTRINDGGRYTGKTPEDTAALADEVCAVRAPGKVPGKPPRLGDQSGDFLTPDGMKRVHEQMACLMTEGPMRFCASSQRKMIVNELTLYFRGIESANRAFGVIRGGNEGRKSVSDDIHPDPRVLAGLDARIRDGQLTAANRDVISSEAPRWVRDRLVKIEPRQQSLCPEKPWWAVWK